MVGAAMFEQQHREGDRIRITAPGTDDEHQQADQRAVNQLAARRGAGRDRVGGDEEGAEDGAAAEQVEGRERVGLRVDHPEQAGDQQQGARAC